MKKILLTGGGTAGHVTPNIALIPRLRELGFEIFYVGSHSGIEKSLITEQGVPFFSISSGKLRRYFDVRNFTDLFRIAAGFFQSLLLLRRLKPDIVFSKGGFVSCPVVWAAWALRTPVVIHESDITPGLANRLSVPFAKKICYSFSETSLHIPSRKAVHTGLPVRDTLRCGVAAEGKRICGFTDNKPIIMVMGGSLGSAAINRTLREALPVLLSEFNVCHVCGKGNTAEGMNGYRQFEYVKDELPHLFAMTDVFVGRSGATTLFELLALKKPSLLIPLGTGASRGDQVLNAQSFKRRGFGEILMQDDLTPATLAEGIKKVYADRRLMVAAMEKCRFPDGVTAVIGVIQDATGEGKV